MNYQYTVSNPDAYLGVFGNSRVVIRTKKREQALDFWHPGYELTPRCLDRVGAGLLNAEHRASHPAQYRLDGGIDYLYGATART